MGYMFNSYLIELIAALVGVVCIALSCYIAWKQFYKKAARYLALFTMCIGFWILSVYFADLSVNLPQLVFWTKSATTFALLLVVSFSIFAYVFRKPEAKAKAYLWWYIPVLALILLNLSLKPAEVVERAGKTLIRFLQK